MKFLIVTHLVHKRNSQSKVGGYGPYIKEMNLWIRGLSEVRVVAPILNREFDPIDIAYDGSTKVIFSAIPAFSLTSFKEVVRAFFVSLISVVRIFEEMGCADHIHIRCPGNVGLLGTLVQIFFPFKRKSAKYAGNWTDYPGQPWSYRLQKWILSNTFLTRNMVVLVYGNWERQSKNILPFFTASYSEKDIVPVSKRDLKGEINFIFVGTLSKNKNPLLSIQVVEQLKLLGIKAKLQLLGEGPERKSLEEYVQEKRLKEFVELKGNVLAEDVKAALKQSHFLLFFSNSEGWPKAVAEAMFWGCVPITKPVSCVPWMLGNGSRGIMVEHSSMNSIADEIQQLIADVDRYNIMSTLGTDWSRQYTLEKFRDSIQLLL